VSESVALKEWNCWKWKGKFIFPSIFNIGVGTKNLLTWNIISTSACRTPRPFAAKTNGEYSMKNNQRKIQCVSLFALGLALSSSVAFAGKNTPSEIAKQNLAKKQTIQLLSERIKNHEKMSEEEIRSELFAVLEANREAMRDQGQLGSEMDAVMTQTAQEIQSFSKPELIQFEKETQMALVSSTNYIFGLTRKMAKDRNVSKVGAIFLAPFSLSADLILIVPELMASLVTLGIHKHR
jgi:hypothetical protein